MTGYEGYVRENIPATVSYGGKDYSVTRIGNKAFAECFWVSSFTLPDGLTSIGEEAFSYCWELVEFTIPNSVETIEKAAFAYNFMQKITIGSGVKSIADEAFADNDGFAEMTVLAVVPPTVGTDAFRGTKRDIPVYVPAESLEAYNLEYCVTDNTAKTAEVIGYVSQPTGTLEIPAYVAYEDAAYSVTDIGDKAFYKSSSFEEVIFSDNVANIGENAFGGCSALMRMTVRAAVPPTVGTMAFKDVSRTIPVYVPVESLDAYKAADVWNEFKLQGISTTGLQTPAMPESIRMQGGTLHNPQGLHLTLYDMQGRQVYSGTAATVSQPAGVYVVRCAPQRDE